MTALTPSVARSLTFEDIASGRMPVAHHALLLVASRLPDEGLTADQFRALALALCGITLSASDEDFWARVGAHPDVFVVNRDANTVKLEDVAPIRERSQFPPSQGFRRLFFIDRCERLPAAPSNALLKVLEEPGAPCLFLFTARSEQAVLPTISSRCFRVAVRLPNQAARLPLDELEDADAVRLVDLFSGASGRSRVAGGQTISARALREVVEKADVWGRKYEAPVLVEACLAAALKAHREGLLPLTTLRFVKEDLRAWRDALVFHPSAPLWLGRVLLRVTG